MTIRRQVFLVVPSSIVAPLLETQRDAKTVAVALDDIALLAAASGEEHPPMRVAERGLARDVPGAVAGRPRRAVGRRPGIALVPAIGDQNEDVPGHVVQPERVGLERP